MNRIIRYPGENQWPHVAIIGGTFDPPHRGHLTLVDAAMHHLHCDYAIIRPSNGNPLKTHNQVDFHHRINMCEILFGNIENVSISSYESKLSYPTYSYLTVQSMFNGEPDSICQNAHYHFMIGEDCLQHLEQWNHLEQIFAFSDIYAVGPNVAHMYENLPSWLQRNMGYIQIPSVVDIHSTQIRNQIKENEYNNTYTSDDVIRYIQKHNLYRE